MVEVKFTIQSVADLDDIATYISKDSFHYARLQVQKLISKTEILETQPGSGRIVPELKNKFIREIFEGKYRIVYRIVNASLIHVLTFHHSKRRFSRSKIRKIIRENK